MSRYIDADKAKEILGTVRCAYNCFEDKERTHYEVLSRTIEMINEMPTADVRENVRGEWISTGFMEVKCSNCKETFHELESANFCPNCGADMRPITALSKNAEIDSNSKRGES